MDQFNVYLPSNACATIYPNNTSTNYKTRFGRNIQLDGEWEVGVESIFYASQFEDTQRRAQIHCSIALDQQLVNDKFQLTPEGKWKGFDGIMPGEFDEFEEDPNKTDHVLNTIAMLNKQIVCLK
jgi:hypothetical protein